MRWEVRVRPIWSFTLPVLAVGLWLTVGPSTARLSAQPPAGDARPAPAPSPAEAPFPDVQRLIREVRANLEPDGALLRQYTYKERRRDVKVSKLGKVTLGPWREFEVYPSDVPGDTYKRLVAVDGRPLPADELARRDADHRTHAMNRLTQRERERPDEKRKRLAKLETERRDDQDAVDDVFAVYDIRIVRRETIEGRPALVTSLTPRPRARTKSDAGKYLKKLRGHAWVNEADRQVVRVEVEAIEDLTFGLGLVARLHKGSTMMFRRALVNNEIWLPAEARVRATGRAVVFRKFAIETTTQFSDYRKFNVSTSEEITSDER